MTHVRYIEAAQREGLDGFYRLSMNDDAKHQLLLRLPKPNELFNHHPKSLEMVNHFTVKD